MNTEDQSTTTATNPAPASTQKATPKRTARRPGQTLACGWCGSSILVPARGRVPKWCSSSCRHRAWEPVSYTHLRAHETRHDLVCRLLLEKKKKNKRTTQQRIKPTKKKQHQRKQTPYK